MKLHSKLKTFKTDYPDQCYDSIAKIPYKIGEHYPERRCSRIICNPDFSIEFQR